MSPVIPFRRRPKLPSLLIVLGAVAAAVIGITATMIFLNWQSKPEQAQVQILRPNPNQSGQIDVIDGDTVRFSGAVYRLVGFDTPERGDKARCDDERRRAEAATMRLRALIGSGNARLESVACACRPELEGTRQLSITGDCVDRCRSVDVMSDKS